MNRECAVLAGGCFWCLDAVFSRLRGVEKVLSGYMGGHIDKPSYKQVCGADTGHAEVVAVYFDARQISYAELLEVFFAIHDPTTLNRQGNDVGPQYRSAIFYQDASQQALALAAIKDYEASHTARVVTEVVPVATLWPAEDYHQGYFDANPYQPYCMAVVAPKVRKLLDKFSAKVRAG
ncbi:peptide-methionine (S)-S-oxide reductase MsrA [Chitinimonas sp.]|uniref:peptide-methionine (S)-S-oxide reductase MsrA n=1 Tax=Chitinimonas sp. TaxID=1934313 RepID=UPI0035AF7933